MSKLSKIIQSRSYSIVKGNMGSLPFLSGKIRLSANLEKWGFFDSYWNFWYFSRYATASLLRKIAHYAPDDYAEKRNPKRVSCDWIHPSKTKSDQEELTRNSNHPGPITEKCSSPPLQKVMGGLNFSIHFSFLLLSFSFPPPAFLSSFSAQRPGVALLTPLLSIRLRIEDGDDLSWSMAYGRRILAA